MKTRDDISNMSDEDLDSFLRMYMHQPASFKESISYPLYLEERKRRKRAVLSTSDVLRALNKLDRLEDDLGLVLVDPQELLEELFKLKGATHGTN